MRKHISVYFYFSPVLQCEKQEKNMNLRDWLYVSNTTNRKLASDIGYSEAAITKYLGLNAKCTDKLAKAVELYTNGEVSAKEMIEWNRKGMEDKANRETQAIPQRLKKEIISDIADQVCECCKKKLTKVYALTKKE
jgi:hypothetical protein